MLAGADIVLQGLDREFGVAARTAELHPALPVVFVARDHHDTPMGCEVARVLPPGASVAAQIRALWQVLIRDRDTASAQTLRSTDPVFKS